MSHRPSNRLLGLIGDAGDAGMTLAVLDASAELDRKCVRNAIEALKTRGLIEAIDHGLYRLTAAGRLARHYGLDIKPGPRGERGPKLHVNGLRARLWKAMRALHKFGLDDLLLRAANGDEAGARNNAVKYLNALERAGYLVRLRRRDPGIAVTSNGFVRWLLIRSTGPRPPIWQAGKGQIHDPNTGAVHALAEPAREVTHA